MNATTQFLLKASVRCGILAVATTAAFGQTLINLGAQGRNVDFSSAPFTRPVKTGTALPASCSVGDLFFNTTAPAGQNLYGCPAANGWTLLGTSGLSDPGANGLVVRTGVNTSTTVAAPFGLVVGTTDSQTLTNKSIDASEINSGTLAGSLMPAFSGDISTSAGSTAATLANVNPNPGTYGDSSHAVQLTVDTKGRITGVSQVAVAGGGGSSITPGALSAISASCSPGTLYFATDQPAGQQLYSCSSANTWTQLGSIGPSGALAVNNGALDIVTSVVPRLMAANTFTGLNNFTGGVQMQASGTQPSCSSTLRGLFWYLNNGSSKDGIQVCVYNGSAFAWVNLY